MNSPTLPCSSSATRLVNTTVPYCVLPGGAQRLDYCCSERGSAKGPPALVPDCYFWCELVFDGQGDIERQFANARNAFTGCLTSGTNASRSLGGMVCTKGLENGDGEDDDDDSNNDNNTDGDVSGDMPPEEGLGVSLVKSGNAKLVGFIGGLLMAGMVVGGL